MEMLAATAMEAAALNGRTDADLEDAVMAMEDWKIVMQHVDGGDTEGIDDFLRWLRSPAGPRRALQVGRLQQQTLSALGAAQGAAIAAQQGSHDMQAAHAAHQMLRGDDWLKMLVNKQILMGHDKRFKGTVVGPEEDVEEFVIQGGPTSIEDWNNGDRRLRETMEE